MARAMPWPCCGPKTRVRRISRSRVPCRRLMRSGSGVVIRPKNIPAWVVCQPKSTSLFREQAGEGGAEVGLLIGEEGLIAGDLLANHTLAIDEDENRDVGVGRALVEIAQANDLVLVHISQRKNRTVALSKG